jgi:ComEC/Rec2-related protein
MKKFLYNQRENLFLWSPVTMAFGVALYFSLFNEPQITTLAIMFIIGIAAIIALRRRPFFAIIACFILGFGYAGIYTHMKSVPTLRHDVHGIEITGNITKIDTGGDKTKIYLHTENFGNVRVSTTNEIKINIGDVISGNGGLFKPKPADTPHGFDFARHAYFNNISATGYLRDIKIIYTADSGVYSVRDKIHNLSKSFLSDTLVLGYKNALPDGHNEIWRTNGMAHIWSISGYHMTLIGGWLFILFYFIFRLFPSIVRHVPARIPAIACTWVGLLGYVFISGAGVATLRAFIMATLVMAAFMLGRNALSLRMVCLAFFAIMLINPYYVMTAGFQLSFGAIFGIIWLWQNMKPRTPNMRLLKYAYTAVLTALVATVFTLPFIILHFGTVPIYGIIGNLVFLPIFSFIIMPLVIAGTLCAVIGIHTPLELAHFIYDKAYHIAERLANFPYSELTFGNIPNTAIILITIGFACLIFIKDIDSFKNFFARHIGPISAIIFISAGIIVCMTTPKPIFYLSSDHKLIATPIDGKLQFNKSHDSGNYFAFDNWKKFNGEKIGTENLRYTAESGVYTISQQNFDIVYFKNFVSLSKHFSNLCDNPHIKYIASNFDIKSEKCADKIIHGGGVIYKSGKMILIPSNRWWHNRPE